MAKMMLVVLILMLSIVYLPASMAQPLAMERENNIVGDALPSSVESESDTDIITMDSQLGESQLPLVTDSIDPVARQQVIEANANNLRIGFINFRRIMASIPQLKSVSATLESEFSQQKMTLANKQQELTDMEQILSTMSRGDAYSDYEKQVIAKRREYVREDAAYRDAYSVRRNEELAKLQRIVVDEIVALAKESDFDVILNDTGVIYVSEDADLTTIVIERLRSIGE